VTNIPILDDDHRPTQDFILGRPLLRVKIWINNDLVLNEAYGLVDTGSRHSAICRTKIGPNIADAEVDDHTSHGPGRTGMFRLAEIQVEQFRRVPVELTLFEGKHFHAIIGRDVLQLCRLVMDHRMQTYTLDML
jgi:hypothetical protein